MPDSVPPAVPLAPLPPPPALVARVLAAIDQAATIGFLQSLIRCPSINPPGDTRAPIALCAETLERAGFATVVAGPTPEQRNLVATLPGRGGGVRLALNAHVDVVPTGDEAAWRFGPFAAEIAEGRVYGRGAGDDKASAAAQVMAGVALARAGVPLAGNLLVTAVADEETGGRYGAGYLVESGLVEADYVIVGEQTRGQLCIGERGAVALGLVVSGVTGHAAAPWSGTNAIEGMGRVIAALQGELWPRLAAGQRRHPLLGQSTGTISMIEGGIKVNVIPDRCEIHIDRRILPEETPESVMAEIQAVAEAALADTPGHRVAQYVKLSRPALLTPPGSPVAQAVLTANRLLGEAPVIGGFFAGTDAKHFAPRGWPTVIMGPGDPATAHAPDEWVGIDEVMAATRRYALAALALLHAPLAASSVSGG